MESSPLLLEALSLDSANKNVLLIRLPAEILSHISALLANSDIKSLRQTCSEVCKAVELRLSRVFLSPNATNIKVFRAVADHPTFRHDVREIIYDDARLRTSWLTHYIQIHDSRLPQAPVIPPDATPFERYRLRLYAEKQLQQRSVEYLKTPEEKRAVAERGAMHWFRAQSARNAAELQVRRGEDDPLLPQHAARAEMLAVQPPWEKCWAVYASLAREQLRIIEAGEDEEAFAYGLSRFPNLKRVAITPATHGFMYTPLYETPMIRALPTGFNQPMPRGWPFVKKTSMSETSPWVVGADIAQSEVDAVQSCWRGLLMVLKQLAEEIEVKRELVIPELVMDVHGLNMGLNPHMFGQMSPDYAHLETILAQPGFKRLELPIMVGGMAAERWACLTNGFFRGLLAKAKDLEHFRLSGDSGGNPANQGLHRNPKHCPLSRIFPLGRWKQLRHFGLSRMPVHVDDLLSVLKSLPDAVRSVELSFLRFPDQEGGYRKLLGGMKSTLLWRERPAADRPTVHIGLPVGGASMANRGIWVSKEISEFLYCGGPNPFSLEPARVDYGVGIMKDDYEPEYERPHARPEEMVKLGFYPQVEAVKEGDGSQ